MEFAYKLRWSFLWPHGNHMYVNLHTVLNIDYVVCRLYLYYMYMYLVGMYMCMCGACVMHRHEIYNVCIVILHCTALVDICSFCDGYDRVCKHCAVWLSIFSWDKRESILGGRGWIK